MRFFRSVQLKRGDAHGFTCSVIGEVGWAMTVTVGGLAAFELLHPSVPNYFVASGVRVDAQLECGIGRFG